MPRILQGICEAIEDSHGRLTPFVYEYNSYMRNRMKYLQEIVADRHFDEKMGSTFINVIDRKAILDAISSKSQLFIRLTQMCSYVCVPNRKMLQLKYPRSNAIIVFSIHRWQQELQS